MIMMLDGCSVIQRSFIGTVVDVLINCLEYISDIFFGIIAVTLTVCYTFEFDQFNYDIAGRLNFRDFNIMLVCLTDGITHKITSIRFPALVSLPYSM